MVSDAPALAQPCGVPFSSCPDAPEACRGGEGRWRGLGCRGSGLREDTGMGAQVGRGREGGTVP